MISNVSSGGYSPMMQGMQGKMPPSAEEMAEKLMSAADTDSDGAISKAEFSAMFESSESADTSKVSSVFADMDADGDESISSSEASDAVSNLLQQLQEQRMAGNMPPPPPPPNIPSAEDLLTSADTDESGSLNLDEFTSALKLSEDEDESILSQLFDKTDVDGDGIVTQEELSTAMEKERQSNASARGDTGQTAANKASFVMDSLLQQYQQNSMSITSDSALNIVA